LPVHEGGSLVNRWLFTKTWNESVADGLLGPEPTHPIMRNERTIPRAAGPALSVARIAGRAINPDSGPQVRAATPRRTALSRANGAKKGTA
jgi:hypothetical protein